MKTITLKTTVTSEVVYELPIYFKQENKFIAILSEEETIEVNYWPTVYAAHISKYKTIKEIPEDYEQITHQDYLEISKAAQSLIDNLLNNL
jgi:hypothetical protein